MRLNGAFWGKEHAMLENVKNLRSENQTNLTAFGISNTHCSLNGTESGDGPKENYNCASERSKWVRREESHILCVLGPSSRGHTRNFLQMVQL
mmetsp:Transcript_1472/g.1989  ORF Transcript_1472/g.1989 Transcript_1472/m.1989 type:complete len:93 (+) Transcript_1472:401-679(+)